MRPRHCLVSMTHMPGSKSTLGRPNHMSQLHQCPLWLKIHSVTQEHLSPLLPQEQTQLGSLSSHGVAPALSLTLHHSSPSPVLLVNLRHLHSGHSAQGHPLTSMSLTASLPSARPWGGSSGSLEERSGCGTRADGGPSSRTARVSRACVLTRTAGSCQFWTAL